MFNRKIHYKWAIYTMAMLVITRGYQTSHPMAQVSLFDPATPQKVTRRLENVFFRPAQRTVVEAVRCLIEL